MKDCPAVRTTGGTDSRAKFRFAADEWPGVYLPALRNWWSGLLAGRNLAAHPADEVASSSYSLVSDAGFADVVASCSCGLLDC
ncbi:uncharacterized protein LOC125941583 isoform X2 [Dermacentor silvarum]|uniref:uncharacterized protein LOC125941583 isoform X2 n=1 Tax=Dermacentor silvarum TaxID=543639 RepID=UPI002100827B|nr:uncharacterized protein LOC125941583 isoform X2 [Dermacentor silvarum]